MRHRLVPVHRNGAIGFLQRLTALDMSGAQRPLECYDGLAEG
jgi:hypothetical protein